MKTYLKSILLLSIVTMFVSTAMAAATTQSRIIGPGGGGMGGRVIGHPPLRVILKQKAKIQERLQEDLSPGARAAALKKLAKLLNELSSIHFYDEDLVTYAKRQ